MIVTRDTFDEVVSRFREPKKRGLDSETTGVSEDDSIFSLIISDETGSYYFNTNTHPMGAGPGETILPRALLFDGLRPILTDGRNSWFIANAKFDWRMLAKENCSLTGRVHCTQAIERVIKNNYFNYKLTGQAERRGLEKDEAVDTYIDKNKLFTLVTVPGKKKAYQQKHFDRVPFDIIAPYGCKDGELHYLIGLDQERQIDEFCRDSRYPSIRPVVENEIRLTKTCFNMERRGILVDKAYAAKGLEYEIDQSRQAQADFAKIAGEPYEDSRALFVRLFTRLGCPYPKTAAGNPSFKAEVLEGMKNPAADAINKIRYHEKRAGTYYSSFIYFADKDNVIHANAQQGGTETGRFSYRDPNLQNVPKEDEPEDQEIPYHVRSSFIPRPGHFYYSLDYQQMEYRMMFDYAGDLRFIRRVLDGEDIHQVTADMCGISRKHAKTLNFAILYGAGVDKIASMLGVSLREAKDLKATYFGRMPKVQKLINAIVDSGKARGFVWNWYGRRCHIAQRDWAYVLPNHVIQGGCGDVVKIAMNGVDDLLERKGAQTKLLLQVHDELLYETPFGEEDIVQPIVDIMENVYKADNGMRLTTSIEHSFKSWGYRDKIKGLPNAVPAQAQAGL